jgi:hypothetical protein
VEEEEMGDQLLLEVEVEVEVEDISIILLLVSLHKHIQSLLEVAEVVDRLEKLVLILSLIL